MGPALFQVQCQVRAGKDIKEAETAMNEVVAAAATAPVTEQELQRVRAAARRNDVGMRESALNRAISLADNAVLSLVGDLDTKTTLAKVEKYFGSIPRQAAPKPVDLSEQELKAERRESMTDPLARVPQINMGFRIPPATHADWPALSVLAQILGSGESSRLYQAVVKEKELCTGTGAGSGARMGPALFQFSCSVRAGKDIKEAELAMNEVIAAAATAPVTEQELQRVRASARRSDVGMRESALNRALTLADYAVLYNDPNRINTLSAKLTAVRLADVQRVARTYLRPENRVVMQTLPGAATPPAPPSIQSR